MTPTTKLRWVTRVVSVPVTENTARYEPLRVLQQYYEHDTSVNIGWATIPVVAAQGEWRDVPLENEHEI